MTDITEEAKSDLPAHVEGLIEMPRSTIWPLVLSLGLALLVVGLVTNLVFSIVGAAILFAGLGGWISELRPHEGEELIPVIEMSPLDITRREKFEKSEVPHGRRLRLPTTISPDLGWSPRRNRWWHS